MLGTILSIVGGVSDAIGIYKFGSALAKGDDTERVLGALGSIHTQIERLNDNILYAPDIAGLSDTTGAIHRLDNLRDVRELLEPVQVALGGEIVSSGLIATPAQMESAMLANPWAVLEDIRPQHLAARPTNPDKVPVLFEHNGMRFVGWQMRGALPMLFNCELRDLPGLGASLVPEAREVPRVAAPATPVQPVRRDYRVEVDAAIVHNVHGRWFLPSAGKTEWFQDIEGGPEMVVVPAGSFMMGSPADEPERRDTDGPQHDVTIAKPFAVGRHAITRGQFAAFVNATGHNTDSGARVWTGTEWKFDPSKSWRNPGFAQDDGHPVVCVNWEDAQAYAHWLSQKTGKVYRLPTEAEWEYVCRAGTTTPYWCGKKITRAQANYHCKGVEWRMGTMLVESFDANPWGLYQVHGNVWEICEDVWHDSYNGAPTDGMAWLTGGDGSRRVIRGGFAVNDVFKATFVLRAVNRSYTVGRSDYLGFRLGRTLTS